MILMPVTPLDREITGIAFMDGFDLNLLIQKVDRFTEDSVRFQNCEKIMVDFRVWIVVLFNF
jgi:hypothetical protein